MNVVQKQFLCWCSTETIGMALLIQQCLCRGQNPREGLIETVGQHAKLYTGSIAFSEAKFKDLQSPETVLLPWQLPVLQQHSTWRKYCRQNSCRWNCAVRFRIGSSLLILWWSFLLLSMPIFMSVCRRSSKIEIDIVSEKWSGVLFVTTRMFMSIFVFVPAVFRDISRHAWWMKKSAFLCEKVCVNEL